VVPVVVGTAAGYLSSGHLFVAHVVVGGRRGLAGALVDHQLSVPNALLALVVALGLQIGTNYINDYADGLRGTDEVRVGPVRLVAGKLASPRAVQMAAALSFAVAAAAGVALAVRVSYWLLPVGLLCGLAGWAYTGGRHPYGYLGFGELFVFVFFGLVATAGSAYVQHAPFDAVAFHQTFNYSYPWGLALWAGVPIGLLAAALLQANNLRDIETDRVAGKKTLAVRLGRPRAGIAYVVTLMAAAAAIGVLQHYRGYALIALVAIPLALGPVRLALGTLQGRSLLPMLPATARLQLAVGALLAAGLLLVSPN
jgi:1,4-dihydroxy-2-naphthoate octaprenyltransferase